MHDHDLENDYGHSHSHTHTHVGEDGRTYTHTHDGSGEGEVHSRHSHTHTHDPAEVKAIVNRLSRAIGHLESVRQMVASGRDCTEVLTQISAVRSALNNTGLLILQGHIEHCIVEAAQEGDMEAIRDLNTAIARYCK